MEIAICEATSCRREALTVAVVALDGDVLVPVDSRKGIPGQLETIANVAGHLGALVKNGHRLVITHGNASQVGYMLLRGEVARHVIHSLPLDICGADTQGATGYMLQQALCNWFSRHGLDQEVATLVTQVVVGEPAPPGAPCTKGIGPFFDWERAQALINNHKWEFDMVPGHGYQRIVPCLTPKKIVEARSIRNLFDNGAVVICAGGGGIPVRALTPPYPPLSGGAGGDLVGIEAVVDKAYTAELLAEVVQAKTILFVSPWERIVETFHLSLVDKLHRIDLSNLDTLIEQSSNMEDTMRHKLIISRHFLLEDGRSVFFLPPDQLGAVPHDCSGVLLQRSAISYQLKPDC